MGIRTYIETVKDQHNWEEALLALPKEKLVDLIVDKMTRDNGFCREVYNKIDKDKVKRSIEEVINEYEEYANNEMKKRVPDVNILTILGEAIFERAEDNTVLMECLKLYIIVIEKMDDAMNEGAGFYDENEWAIFDLMDRSGEAMVESIRELYANLSENDIEEVRDYLQNKAKQYNPIDGVNRIMTAYEMIIAKGCE